MGPDIKIRMVNFLLLIILTLSLPVVAGFEEVDHLVETAISNKTLPGAVIQIGTSEKILSTDVYGTKDTIQKNSEYTIYDLASLTKVVGTATSVMILVEQGKISVTDKISDFLPEFNSPEKENLTIEDIMRHRSGLPASGGRIPGETYSQFIRRISSAKLAYKPRTDTVYSDVGFILLGYIVEKVSGMTLNEFAKKFIFKPLKMNHTSYEVSESDKINCAPTLKNRSCIPHDPTAFKFYPQNLGHAGLFSNIHDISRFAQMYLNKGVLDGVRILEEKSVKEMIILPEGELRGLGWDLLSPYAGSPRGLVFPAGVSYGHTGFTGTTIWIDPSSDTFYVFLSNRVLLGEDVTQKPFTTLRREVSTAIGKAIYSSSIQEIQK